MNTKLLIDSIVQQTTVLIAQLSTAAGIRAPLADIADQVFLDLSRALEAEGVPRKVVADMFGLALRGYQKKVQRLNESGTDRGSTLWQAVIEHLGENGALSRREIMDRFQADDPASVGAVLNDLVSSGLLYKKVTGNKTVYGVTTEAELRAVVREHDYESLSALLQVEVYRRPGITPEELAARFSVDEELFTKAFDDLVQQAHIEPAEGGGYRARTVMIPVGSGRGWEAAVFDHFQAMVAAIGAKLRAGQTRSEHGDVIGGATLTYDIHDAHPLRDEVLSLLSGTRETANDLLARVDEHNEKHPIAEGQGTLVSFYFGQNVKSPEDES